MANKFQDKVLFSNSRPVTSPSIPLGLKNLQKRIKDRSVSLVESGEYENLIENELQDSLKENVLQALEFGDNSGIKEFMEGVLCFDGSEVDTLAQLRQVPEIVRAAERMVQLIHPRNNSLELLDLFALILAPEQVKIDFIIRYGIHKIDFSSMTLDTRTGFAAAAGSEEIILSLFNKDRFIIKTNVKLRSIYGKGKTIHKWNTFIEKHPGLNEQSRFIAMYNSLYDDECDYAKSQGWDKPERHSGFQQS